MAALRQLLTVPLALISFVATFYAVGKLMFFLSAPQKIHIASVWVINLLDNRTKIDLALLPITIDTILVICFILQHSLLRTDFVKAIWSALGLESAERSIYNLATAGVLLFLLKHWQPVPSIILWNVDVESSKILWWAFALTHALAWIIIYGGTIILDFAELLGVKQVYHDVNNLLAPIVYKSRDLVRLYGHVRHPSFIGLTIILWVTNLLSLDRLLLAVLWTVYMYVAWNTDQKDINYQKNQLERKKRELSYSYIHSRSY